MTFYQFSTPFIRIPRIERFIPLIIRIFFLNWNLKPKWGENKIHFIFFARLNKGTNVVKINSKYKNNSVVRLYSRQWYHFCTNRLSILYWNYTLPQIIWLSLKICLKIFFLKITASKKVYKFQKKNETGCVFLGIQQKKNDKYLKNTKGIYVRSIKIHILWKEYKRCCCYPQAKYRANNVNVPNWAAAWVQIFLSI